MFKLGQDHISGYENGKRYQRVLQVCALLHHEFQVDRYAYSRMMDPIVGVSFTGLFDFFATCFGREWLEWMASGRDPGFGRAGELEAMARVSPQCTMGLDGGFFEVCCVNT